jgi:hypothetical protein
MHSFYCKGDIDLADERPDKPGHRNVMADILDGRLALHGSNV